MVRSKWSGLRRLVFHCSFAEQLELTCCIADCVGGVDIPIVVADRSLLKSGMGTIISEINKLVKL